MKSCAPPVCRVLTSRCGWGDLGPLQGSAPYKLLGGSPSLWVFGGPRSFIEPCISLVTGVTGLWVWGGQHNLEGDFGYLQGCVSP